TGGSGGCHKAIREKRAGSPPAFAAFRRMKGDMPLDRRLFSHPRRCAQALLLAGCTSLWLSACSTNEMTTAVYVERPIEQIYNAAWFEINRENWLEAGKQFDEVERQH